LNKKLEALRRGLRSFIEDTSRELADLEGRAAAEDAAAERPPAAPGSADDVPTPPPGVRSQIESPEEAAIESRMSGVAPAPEPATPRAAPAAEAFRPAAEEARRAEHPTKTPPPPAQHPAKSPRRPQATLRRRRRPQSGAKTGVNGVRAEQAQARKGVCFAYFLNNECWRVPDAYCNSALQVCITRECPVYHLHKEAFERRFARKFDHFW
jgi:hypothetical protein